LRPSDKPRLLELLRACYGTEDEMGVVTTFVVIALLLVGLWLVLRRRGETYRLDEPPRDPRANRNIPGDH